MKKIKSLKNASYENILKALEERFDIHISLHDLRGILRDDDANPLLYERRIHRHPCCFRSRFRKSGWNKACYNDCFTQSEKTAGRERAPFLKTCWKGIIELVVPVIHNGQHMLSFYIGSFRNRNTPPPPLKGASEWFKPLYEALPEPDNAMLSELAGLLTVFGNGMLFEQENRDTQPFADSRLAVIMKFIRENAHKNVLLSDLANALHLSVSRTGHLIHELSGKSFQALLLEEKMLRAKTLLLSSDSKLEAVADATGFSNGFYFNRAFSNFYGQSPGRFRKTHSHKI